ncbi:MAG: DUF4388 domain-containing protein [Chloroflexi bacterium]|uniref:DUF4388 domain-containing protein n=1 Tax=Candidatus Chlorohelix allophototropha TaxID=3003348 RepID=A0A8T7MAU3_9CHLR|nr:DUF4388 domain-containing protein [Chloroflexota bacterium]WJW68960.1 DUF4388 domain-containing protein [Chloroflexota bacterium L227-S17]
MASSTILNGRIDKTDLPTLLRTAEKEKLSGELGFQRQNEKINLYYLFGQLYHAKWGDINGIDAVRELLNWRNGTYIFTEGIIPAQASINDDIDLILAKAPNRGGRPQTGSLPAIPQSVPISVALPNLETGNYMADLVPFDLKDLGTSDEQASKVSASREFKTPPSGNGINQNNPELFELPPTLTDDNQLAHEPPSNGLYRTRYICLPLGEQMSNSLVATGPQLEGELISLASIGFTGYVLGGPEVDGLPAVGIAMYHGRFIHAFYHARGQTGPIMHDGEKAFRAVIEQKGSGTARFYWFYEISMELMRASIALLTPPTRYSHLEVRIVRFKELLRMLGEENHTGCVRINVSPKAIGSDGKSSLLAGETAYIPLYEGSIMGLWTDNFPRISNDGQLLQRFLNEPQAYLDLHTTVPISEPGLTLETVLRAPTANHTEKFAINVPPAPTMTPPEPTQYTPIPQPPLQPTFEPLAVNVPMHEQVMPLDDDERQLRLITAISRMESTWTQAQKKERVEMHTALLLLAGFVNDVLSLSESANGRRVVLEMINHGLQNEFAPYINFMLSIDIPNGRINLVKLLRGYEVYSREGERASSEFYREAAKALRTVIRSCFQSYVGFVRRETVRFESQEMYEIFLQDVVRRI